MRRKKEKSIEAGMPGTRTIEISFYTKVATARTMNHEAHLECNGTK